MRLYRLSPPVRRWLRKICLLLRVSSDKQGRSGLDFATGNLFRTLVGRGVGLVFCDLPHVPPGLNNAASWPRGGEWQNDRRAVASPLRRGTTGPNSA